MSHYFISLCNKTRKSPASILQILCNCRNLYIPNIYVQFSKYFYIVTQLAKNISEAHYDIYYHRILMTEEQYTYIDRSARGGAQC